MAHLKVVPDSPKPLTPRESKSATVHTGRRYDIECRDHSILNSIHGVIGDYRITTRDAAVLPVAPVSTADDTTTCFFGETDIVLPAGCYLMHPVTGQTLPLESCTLKTNRFVLKGAALDGPELTASNDATILRLSPRFIFTFSTDIYPAELGVVHLVQSTRFITLKNGDTRQLLNTNNEDRPALYLENSQDDQGIKFVAGEQEMGVTQDHTFSTEISQTIPDEFTGETVASVTVLEQYHSYFMQREVSSDAGQNIWTPVCAPITWGWSIRVGRRTDGEWGILRRKLILATSGNDGLQFPTWNHNTVDCALMVDTKT